MGTGIDCDAGEVTGGRSEGCAGVLTADMTASISFCDSTSSIMPTAEGNKGGLSIACGCMDPYIGVSSDNADMCSAIGDRADGV